jgi:hypothetical protein
MLSGEEYLIYSHNINRNIIERKVKCCLTWLVWILSWLAAGRFGRRGAAHRQENPQQPQLGHGAPRPGELADHFSPATGQPEHSKVWLK